MVIYLLNLEYTNLIAVGIFWLWVDSSKYLIHHGKVVFCLYASYGMAIALTVLYVVRQSLIRKQWCIHSSVGSSCPHMSVLSIWVFNNSIATNVMLLLAVLFFFPHEAVSIAQLNHEMGKLLLEVQTKQFCFLSVICLSKTREKQSYYVFRWVVWNVSYQHKFHPFLFWSVLWPAGSVWGYLRSVAIQNPGSRKSALCCRVPLLFSEAKEWSSNCLSFLLTGQLS